MRQEFEYDVFLSHSAKDKAMACPFAERLRKDRLGTVSEPSTAWRFGLTQSHCWGAKLSDSCAGCREGAAMNEIHDA
jgi:hypothetical protein